MEVLTKAVLRSKITVNAKLYKLAMKRISLLKKRLDYIEGIIDDLDMSEEYRLDQIEELCKCKDSQIK